MRKISKEKDYYQLVVIFFLIFIYFKFIYFLRDNPYPATLIFLIFLLNFFLTTRFFYIVIHLFNPQTKYSSFFLTMSYSLVPTLIWFITSSVLFIFFPPPRTASLLGSGFSILFFAFSISLLAWKIILIYLALRFSSRLGFYRILYMMLLFLVWFLPYSVFLYQVKLFRVPFI